MDFGSGFSEGAQGSSLTDLDSSGIFTPKSVVNRAIATYDFTIQLGMGE